MKRVVLSLLLAGAVATAGEKTVKLYDVGDLLHGRGAAQEIAALVRAADDGVARVEVLAGHVLSVTADDSGQMAAARVLEGLRRRRPEAVSLKAHLLSTSASLGGSKGTSAWFTRTLTPRETDTLLSANKEGREAWVSVPRSGAEKDRAFSVECGERLGYVRGYRLEDRGQDGIVAHPVIATAFDGVRLSATPLEVVQGRISACRVEIEVHRVVRPIPAIARKLSGKTPVEVQAPEIRGTTESRTIALPQSGSILIGVGMDPAHEGRYLSVLLKPAGMGAGTATKAKGAEPEDPGAEKPKALEPATFK